MNRFQRALTEKVKEEQPSVAIKPHRQGGIQKVYSFKNGWGASVVMFPGSYGFEKGLWELAVLDANEELCYDTPITDDVIGCLDDRMTGIILERIKNL